MPSRINITFSHQVSFDFSKLGQFLSLIFLIDHAALLPNPSVGTSTPGNNVVGTGSQSLQFQQLEKKIELKAKYFYRYHKAVEAMKT